MSKKLILLIVVTTAFVVSFSVYLAQDSHRGPGFVSVKEKPPPSKTGRPVTQKPTSNRELVTQSPRDIIRQKTHGTTFLGESVQGGAQVSSGTVSHVSPQFAEALPERPVEPIMPGPEVAADPPPIVPPPEEMLTVKLCGGKPISQCTDVDFTHTDFALLLLDIIDLPRTEDPMEAFEILESFGIKPSGGWAASDPNRHMTRREMEELRCSVSLASEEGMISEGPALVAAAVDRFCQELEVSLKAIKDSGVVKDRGTRQSIETGYQGGSETVVSSPF